MSTRNTTGWMPGFGLIMIVALLGVGILPAPSRAAEVVERWRGRLAGSQSINVDPFGSQFVPATARERFTLDFDLRVLTGDVNGALEGTVTATLQSSTVDIPGNVCVGGTMTSCVITLTPLSRRAIWTVKGTRFQDTEGKLGFVIDEKQEQEVGRLMRSTCGLQFDAIYICIEGDESWSPDFPDEYDITTYNDGRPPLATPHRRRLDDNQLGVHISYTGQIVGYGKEPILGLDTELLERSVFFAQVPVDDQLDANVDWNSVDAGIVTWQVAQEAPRKVGPTRSNRVPEKVNVGPPNPGQRTVKVQAQNTLGLLSQPQTTHLTAAPLPSIEQFSPPSEIAGQKQGDIVAYKFKFKFPDPRFKMEGNVPGVVPFFGAHALGIANTQVVGEVDVKSTGEGFARGEAEMGFMAMGQKLRGSLGAVAVVILNADGVSFPRGDFEAKVSGKIEGVEPLIVLIPSIGPAASAAAKLNPALKSLIEKLVFRIEVEPKISIIAKLKNNNGLIDFVAGQVKPAIGIKGMLVFEPIKDVFIVQAGVGGEASFTVHFPAPHFQGANVKLLAFAKISYYYWSMDSEASISEKIHPSSGLTAELWDLPQRSYHVKSEPEAESAQLWVLMDRAYLDDADYGQWVADDRSPAPSAIAPVDETLVANVFPQAHPSLAASGDFDGLGRAMLAWTHDQPGKALANSGEIYYALNTGMGWDVGPMRLTDDNQADFNPQSVLLPDSRGLIGWERFDTPAPGDINVDPTAYMSHIQVAAAQMRHPNGNGAINQISQSGSMNYRPQFAPLGTSAIAAWINNPANQLLGDATHPDTLLWSRYNMANDTWSAPAPIVSNLAGLLDYKLATSGDNAALVYSRDMDGDMATNTDRDLFATRLVNGTWTTPVQMTSNSVADEAPQLALAADGSPLLVWRQAGALKFLSKTWNATPAPVPLSGPAGGDYELVRSEHGGLALTWQEPEPNDTRIGYALFDPNTGRWSNEQTLAPPAAIPGSSTMAMNISPALIGSANTGLNDQLMAAYQLVETSLVTQTADDEITPNVPGEQKHSLHVVQQRVQTNLTVKDADLQVTPDLARPGEPIVIHAAIHNTGHFAVGNVPVQLVSQGTELGDAATVVMSKTLPLLAAGETFTMTFPITHPATGVNTYAVNIPLKQVQVPSPWPDLPPTQRALETDYRDNYARLKTDLAISPLATQYMPEGAVAVAEVTQHSGLYTRDEARAIVRLGAHDGPKIGETRIKFPLTPTTTISATQWISTTVLGKGSHTLYWQLDPENIREEQVTIDNITATRVDIFPDLSSGPELIGWGRAPGTTTPFSMRVQNDGNWASEASVADIFDGEPGLPGTHRIGQVAIPAIAPGEFAEVGGMLTLTGLSAATTGLQRIVVELDPAKSLPELNENNNLLVVGGNLGDTPVPPSHNQVYLPHVRR